MWADFMRPWIDANPTTEEGYRRVVWSRLFLELRQNNLSSGMLILLLLAEEGSSASELLRRLKVNTRDLAQALEDQVIAGISAPLGISFEEMLSRAWHTGGGKHITSAELLQALAHAGAKPLSSWLDYVGVGNGL